MRIAIASDHAGYFLKQTILNDLKALGCEVIDLGTYDPNQPSDYPDFAERVSEAVREGQADRGIVICGSGVGASITANKFPGIRASVCHDIYSAHQGVEHDDMNVLCLGARVIGQELAREIVKAFIFAKFLGEERHTRRLQKIKLIEERFFKSNREG